MRAMTQTLLASICCVFRVQLVLHTVEQIGAHKTGSWGLYTDLIVVHGGGWLLVVNDAARRRRARWEDLGAGQCVVAVDVTGCNHNGRATVGRLVQAVNGTRSSAGRQQLTVVVAVVRGLTLSRAVDGAVSWQLASRYVHTATT